MQDGRKLNFDPRIPSRVGGILESPPRDHLLCLDISQEDPAAHTLFPLHLSLNKEKSSSQGTWGSV